MRLHTGWQSLLLPALLLTSASAKKDKPSISQSSFPFWPYNVQYFDDSDVLLFQDLNDHIVYRSTDAGVKWEKVSDVPPGKVLEMTMHPYDNKRAYIITNEKSHWMTKDRGETWDDFYTDSLASLFREALTFHAGDPDRIIFNGIDCTGIFCEELTMYTTNGFATDTRFLRSDTEGCHWAKSTEIFTTGQKDLDDNRIICVVKGRFSPWKKDFRLLISDNFFTSNGDDIQEFEPELEPGRTVQGILGMDVVTKYLVAAASAEGTDELALYVSDDTIKWHRAVFPHDHKIIQKAYTILEGTNYSIQIDVMNTRRNKPMGVFLSSNSNGTYFTRNAEHTNRHSNGLVDFEKVAGVQGIVLINTVDNWEEVENMDAEKHVKSQISFDDGRTWTSLKTAKNKKDLHLHSVTDLDNSGRVFSSPAPGIVMGIGNTGDYLKPFQKGNLYVSDDAGVTWHKGLDGPHKYEFGDQGSVLVAIEDAVTDEISYSLNHGKKWEAVKLDQKVKPLQLTTTKDSTSLKFLLEAIEDKQENGAGYIIVIDFNDMHEDKCKASDLEEWFARVDEDNNPTCLMGHEQSYMRRLADAKCFMMKEFEDPVPKSTRCPCTDDDFECDYNFVRSSDRKECIQAGALVLPDDACKAFDAETTFMGSSGWRLIPGNDCKRESGPQKDDPVPRKCVEAVGPPSSGDITHVQVPFTGHNFQDIVYLERTGLSTGEDETVLVRTETGVWLSHDHGKNWNQILNDEEITDLYPHAYFNDVIFFITPSEKVFYSTDRGENIRSFEAPHPPNTDGLPYMSFHPKNKDWFIWTGANCGEEESTCHSEASLTQDRGDGWRTLQRYVGKCEFIREAERPEPSEKLIYCEVRERESNEKAGNPMQLVSSNDFFSESPTIHFKNVVDFATMSEFIVVATKDEAHSTLKVDASVDGSTFADAEFPHGFKLDHQRAYTVLDSSTHSVFLHVTVNNDPGFEYGTIIKSNSNGTSYVLSVDAVDRDSTGYVDFEKMFGIEGVAMVNVVANYKSKDYKEEGKKLKTMITHNDGGEWDYLPPPAKDADGKKFDCTGSCSLHIHGYTERSDKSHVFYSQSAIGLMMGTGNVGEYLTSLNDADTFMTADGGITWKSVKKGSYMWEFGDQGSIVVIVKERTPTNIIYYSLDEGDSWNEYQFSDEDIEIHDITTVPSDNARNFLLWGYKGGELLTVNLDFTGLTDVQCKLDENHVEEGDYYLWTPKHPKQNDDCLFGHVSQYHRKRIESKCYNGRMIPHLHDIAKNCTCTRQDFECDFNYERQPEGSCKLIPGYSPPDHSQICSQEDVVEYYAPTGYRRIPITTCEGGMEMDKNVPQKCTGKDDEFNKKYGASGVAIFFAVIIPIGVAAGVGYWVWRNWTSKFGQIRLGEQSSFDGEAPYIKYPVVVIAGLVAIVQAIPLLVASLWRSASGMLGRGGSRRFTTRDSFARGRGDYAVVDTDEGELLGEDSDEDV